MPFSDNLKTLRLQHGLTQEKLGSLLHLSRASISRYEAGVLEPSLSTLVELSKIFNITVDQLIQ